MALQSNQRVYKQLSFGVHWVDMNKKDKSRLSTTKNSFTELFFPETPKQLWSKARKLARTRVGVSPRLGPASPLNTAYIYWLQKQSMLQNAKKQALKYSGKASMWQKPFASAKPKSAVSLGSVWFTSYPAACITKSDESILQTLGDKSLWETFEEIGIQGMHTGPMKRAGGLKGWEFTPSEDGHFDRISTKIDPLFGTKKEFRALTEIAAPHGGIIIDDIIPNHTGKGPDFQLATMAVDTYPGIYHMVEIHPKDWHLLPSVPRSKDSQNLNPDEEERLKRAGYIIGKMHRVIFYEPGIKETSWSVTKPIKGVDGVKRRWVYLHLFWEGQPTINWLDPTFSGMQLVIGDALHSLDTLGARGLRLDANWLLGIEKSGADQPAWSESHPLAEASNHIIASMVRKVGGFTFQELNQPIEDIKAASKNGPDLSYDFVTRPAYHHALVTGNAEFLQIMMRSALEVDLQPVSLVHALQNHDELTYELVHLWPAHKDDIYTYNDHQITGEDLRTTVRGELRDKLLGENTPYNLAFTENGIACTTASLIAAALGIADPYQASPEEIQRIQKAHLLLAMFNAFQPGVFALSGWDLLGVLTLKPEKVQDLISTGDTRWVNRGAYDLMGVAPKATHSLSGMPRATNLYATLPQQLQDPQSFTSQLKSMLEIRNRYKLASGHQLEIPPTSDKSMFAMVHKLTQEGQIQVTVLNFSEAPVTATITSEHLPLNASVLDMFTESTVGKVGANHTITVTLDGHQGTSLLMVEQNQ